MSVDLETRWLNDFAIRLSGLEIKRKRIQLAMLWDIFAEVFAHRPDTAERRLWLLKCLRHAEQENIIRFPKGIWENLGKPPLPGYVERIVAAPEPKNKRWKVHYWHHRLVWVADLANLSEEFEQILMKVDEGLKQKRFEQPAPLNRRSVELTGKEKRLKELLNSSLFAEGRLSRSLLNITSDVMPLAHEFVGKNPIALVFENKEPFNVALPILESLPNSPYGILAYGGGNSFADSIGDFVRIQRSARYQEHFDYPLQQIHYVGDLDWAGLSIAHRASRAAQKHNLPSLIPATGIHKAMLDSLLHKYIAHPDGFPCPESKKIPVYSPALVEWLPMNIREQILRILTLNNRIPEEMLTAEELLTIWNSSQ